MKPYKLSWGAHSLSLGNRTCIMGILNVTPDSFSDGGLFFSCDAAVAHGEKLADAGADIIDIGGESTRPFSESVSIEEEGRRVLPVIEKLAKRLSIPISIDTTKAIIAKEAIECGASIINDISAMRSDPDMMGVASKYGVPVVIMHMKGSPKTMQVSPQYDDLIKEIKGFFDKAIDRAEKNGVSRSKIIIDPGIGFSKTVEHNLLIIKHMDKFKTLDSPILIGPSRKSFIRNILEGSQNSDTRLEMSELETGTQASIAAAVLNGANIVRVHDVGKARSTLKIIDSIRNVNHDKA
ncbi:MAG: dihydropteroate synthase [Proteobacteria bacterium]|nr:dihydropteroate synthase [Desulfobacteraceae bacterium]MBU3979745.1 dihydropteroate synthase [Pseudomonadota bacterium]MBU4012866.1 dihydropteroate synthase [Pseudomonadota bacterium]MBU4068668.1 dihydropteroate synthase [Pseudomonadota bacterium]MBU4100385.1 dihydropteroate synthase [Pseudomonadota bacterium]